MAGHVAGYWALHSDHIGQRIGVVVRDVRGVHPALVAAALRPRQFITVPVVVQDVSLGKLWLLHLGAGRVSPCAWRGEAAGDRQPSGLPTTLNVGSPNLIAGGVVLGCSLAPMLSGAELRCGRGRGARAAEAEAARTAV